MNVARKPEWFKLTRDVKNTQRDRRHTDSWLSWALLPKGLMFEVWPSYKSSVDPDDSDPRIIYIGRHCVFSDDLQVDLLNASEPVVGDTFDELCKLHGYGNSTARDCAVEVLEHAMKQGWLTKDQVIEGLKAWDQVS
jgi:hypothetical protein